MVFSSVLKTLQTNYGSAINDQRNEAHLDVTNSDGYDNDVVDYADDDDKLARPMPCLTAEKEVADL